MKNATDEEGNLKYMALLVRADGALRQPARGRQLRALAPTLSCAPSVRKWLPRTPIPTQQQDIADRKSRILRIELDDVAEVRSAAHTVQPPALFPPSPFPTDSHLPQTPLSLEVFLRALPSSHPPARPRVPSHTPAPPPPPHRTVLRGPRGSVRRGARRSPGVRYRGQHAHVRAHHVRRGQRGAAAALGRGGRQQEGRVRHSGRARERLLGACWLVGVSGVLDGCCSKSTREAVGTAGLWRVAC